MRRKKILHMNFSLGNYSQFVAFLLLKAKEGKSSYVCIANVHMFIEAHKDAAFASIVNLAAMVTPDGKPLTWALRLMHGIKQDRVAGMDLLPDLLHKMEQENLSAFFYGGTETMLALTGTFLAEKYPALKIAGLHSPPFRKLHHNEDNAIVNQINQSNPSIVFVILGCPKQEKWMASMQGKIHSVMIGIGGALPVMLGMQKRAPEWMQNMGLEWLFRLAQEPSRLFKRYAHTNSLFVWIFFKEYMKAKVFIPLSYSNPI